MRDARAREIIKTALSMNDLGINRGTSGNVSARFKDGCLITPSGLKYESTKPADIVYLNRDGEPSGRYQPSSEWRFHFDIYQAKPDVGAIVHTHSNFATTDFCMSGRSVSLPVFWYCACGSSAACCVAGPGRGASP